LEASNRGRDDYRKKEGPNCAKTGGKPKVPASLQKNTKKKLAYHQWEETMSPCV